MNFSEWTTRISPLLKLLQGYDRSTFVRDLIAGVIVAVMLVPQAMAYAMLAGLPPQVGLYASIVPLALYSFFGSSNSLAVGPVAMVSLLVVSGVGELAEVGSPEFIGYCLTLALMVGVLQIAMALFRLGFLVNFISHPVLTGFTSAAAIVIAASQFKHLFGISIPSTKSPFEMIWETAKGITELNPVTFGIGAASVSLLLFFNHAEQRHAYFVSRLIDCGFRADWICVGLSRRPGQRRCCSKHRLCDHSVRSTCLRLGL
jgi:SulP family sulfate permease